MGAGGPSPEGGAPGGNGGPPARDGAPRQPGAGDEQSHGPQSDAGQERDGGQSQTPPGEGGHNTDPMKEVVGPMEDAGLLQPDASQQPPGDTVPPGEEDAAMRALSGSDTGLNVPPLSDVQPDAPTDQSQPVPGAGLEQNEEGQTGSGESDEASPGGPTGDGGGATGAGDRGGNGENGVTPDRSSKQKTYDNPSDDPVIRGIEDRITQSTNADSVVKDTIDSQSSDWSTAWQRANARISQNQWDAYVASHPQEAAAYADKHPGIKAALERQQAREDRVGQAAASDAAPEATPGVAATGAPGSPDARGTTAAQGGPDQEGDGPPKSDNPGLDMTPPLTEGAPGTPDTAQQRFDAAEATYKKDHPGEVLDKEWDKMTPDQRKKAIPDDAARDKYAEDRAEVKLTAAKKTMTDIEAAHKISDPSKLSEANLGTDYQKYRDARADVALAERIKKIDQQPSATEEQRQQNEKDRVNAMVEAALAKDDRYQKALERQSDNSKDLKAQLNVEESELQARHDALRQRALEGFDEKGNSLSGTAVTKRLKEIEESRIEKSAQARVKATPDYIKLQDENKKIDDALAAAGFSQEQIDSIADMEWDALSKQAQAVFGGNKKGLRGYKYRRDRMKAFERKAEAKAERERVDAGIGEDGRPFTGDVKKAKLNRLKRAREREEPGPARYKEWFYETGKKMDNLFGKRYTDDKRKEAMGYTGNLWRTYGIRGVIPFFMPFIRDDAKRKDAWNLWKQAAGAWWSWGWRMAGPHTAKWVLFLFVVSWLAQPFIMAKAIEVAQPFAANK